MTARGGGWRWSAWGGAALGLLLGLVPGCATSRGGAVGSSQASRPLNVWQYAPVLSPNLRRVAVLPLYAKGQESSLDDGRVALEPILHAELLKTGRFELVPVSREVVQQWTGRSGWAYTDALPRDFLAQILEATGADGILFCQLTRYHAYPPVSVGWRLHLVESGLPRVWWSVDEIFDGSEAGVAAAARSYYKDHFATPTGSDPGSILASPRRFGQWTASCVLSTLPAR